MKYLLLAAALSLGVAGGAAAQTSAPSTNPSAHSQPSTSPQGPVGASMSEQGKTSPCSAHQASGTSDRNGGHEKSSVASGGADSNPNGKLSSGNC